MRNQKKERKERENDKEKNDKQNKKSYSINKKEQCREKKNGKKVITIKKKTR